MDIQDGDHDHKDDKVEKGDFQLLRFSLIEMHSTEEAYLRLSINLSELLLFTTYINTESLKIQFQNL